MPSKSYVCMKIENCNLVNAKNDMAKDLRTSLWVSGDAKTVSDS